MNFTEDMNHTSFQIDENPMFDKVISGITWGILQFPCNALMIGLIQFDRLGGDPLKRRVTDQVKFLKEFALSKSIVLIGFFQLFTNMLCNMVLNNVLKTAKTISIVFDLKEKPDFEAISFVFAHSNDFVCCV